MDIDIVRIGIVELRRPGGYGIVNGEDGRERFVLNVNERQGLQRRIFVDGGNRRYFFAHIADLLGGEKLLVLGVSEYPPSIAAHILRGDNGLDPREPFRF